jgi:glycosyltransferase involved in cell wall biosynthesis
MSLQFDTNREKEMNGERTLVSVIIAVYNGEAFLAEAVESIKDQIYQPLEIIIVDDGSTDGTKKIAASFGDTVCYVHQTNRGPASARNRGIKMAHGNSIGFLDADDMWSKNKLRLQISHLDRDPTLEVVLGLRQYLRLSGIEEGKYKFEENGSPQVALNLGCSLIRKSVFDKVGFFDETLFYCDDWDWFMRCRESGINIMTHKEVTLFQRIHKHNMTRKTELGNHYAISMIKKSLDRRRHHKTGQAKSLSGTSDFDKILPPIRKIGQ